MKLIDPWCRYLDLDLSLNRFEDLMNEVGRRYADHSRCVYPPLENLFAAFNYMDPKKLKVVILGQDPYHGENEANGLAFSVDAGVKLPPSLRNILKEVKTDIGDSIISNGDLRPWTQQGVLLLNTILTVEKDIPKSHASLGWQSFTDYVISKISYKSDHLVFILWGKEAISKNRLIDSQKHLILTSVHPSPLSAYRGFFGCNHFSKCNNFLIANGKEKIIW